MAIGMLQSPPAVLGQERFAAQDSLAEKWGVPDSPVGRAAATVLEMVARGDDAYTEQVIEQLFTEQFRNAFPMEQHVSFFRQLHGDLPGLELADLRQAGEHEASFSMRSVAAGREAEVSVLLDPVSGRIVALRGAPPRPIQSQGGAPVLGPDELRARLARASDANEFSGVLLVARNGEPLFFEAAGFADRGAATPVVPTTRFNIGSLTKVFTASVILQLVGEGAISLDDPIDRYLGGFPAGVGDRVTIRHLLAHRSGWGAYWDHPEFLDNISRLREISEYLRFIRTMPLSFEPGAQEMYSNVGYEVLGGVIESVTGQPYHQVVEARLFDPLGMTRTCSCDFDLALEGVAVGYTNRHPAGPPEGYVRENTHLLAPRGTAAGGTLSTAGDLMTFFRAVYQGTVVDESLAGLLVPRRDTPVLGKRPITVAGGAPGVQALVHYAPRDDRFVVLLSNFDGPVGEQLFQEAREAFPETDGGDA
jgi:CubicO group peptidase (beta-lactamase class C family)